MSSISFENFSSPPVVSYVPDEGELALCSMSADSCKEPVVCLCPLKMVLNLPDVSYSLAAIKNPLYALCQMMAVVNLIALC